MNLCRIGNVTGTIVDSLWRRTEIESRIAATIHGRWDYMLGQSSMRHQIRSSMRNRWHARWMVGTICLKGA